MYRNEKCYIHTVEQVQSEPGLVHRGWSRTKSPIRSSRLGTGVTMTSMIRPHTWCNFSISPIKNLCSWCWCMYSSVQMSFLSRQSFPIPWWSVEGVGRVSWMKRVESFVSCQSFIWNDLWTSLNFSRLNTLNPGELDSKFRLLFSVSDSGSES